MGNISLFNFNEQHDLLNIIPWRLLFGPLVRHAVRPTQGPSTGMTCGSNWLLAPVFIAQEAINTGAKTIPLRRLSRARSRKCPGQRRLPQRLRALEVGIDLGFDFADDGQVAIDFGDDSDLFR